MTKLNLFLGRSRINKRIFLVMSLIIVKIKSSICQKFMKTRTHVQPNSGKITPKTTYKIISGGYKDDPACPKDHKCQEGSCSTAEPDPGLSYYCICGNGVGGQFCDKRVYFKIRSIECGKGQLHTQETTNLMSQASG